jgi:hypothetical protein
MLSEMLGPSAINSSSKTQIPATSSMNFAIVVSPEIACVIVRLRSGTRLIGEVTTLWVGAGKRLLDRPRPHAASNGSARW